MASYSGTSTVHAKTLVANTADTVTLSGDFSRVRVISDGVAAIYYTIDASGAPTVAGDGTYVLPAALTSRVEASPAQQGTVVKLISAGAPTYWVEGA